MIYLQLFWEFFKTGLFAVGGGMATIPFLYDLSDKTGWFTHLDLANMIAVSESTPGPFAVNMATYIGAEMGGIFGSVCATLGVVLPSFVIILIVARCYDRFRNSGIVKGCMSGLKPAVVGLIGNAFLNVLMTVFFPLGVSAAVLAQVSFYIYGAIFALMLVLAFKKVHPIIIICLSAVLGIAVGYLL